MGKQGAADDGLAASGGQPEYQPPFGMIRQGVQNTAEKVLLIGAELAHDDAILSTRRPVSKTELRPTPVLTTSGDSTHSDCGLRCPASTIFAGWRQSVLPVHLLGLAPLLGSVGPVAGDVKLQDDGVVHDPVNRRGGGHGVGEDALPLGEDQV